MKKLITFVTVFAALSVSMATSKKPNPDLQSQCNVHHQVLKKDWVKIRYGSFLTTKAFSEASQKQFPYSNKVVYGGCVRAIATDEKGHITRSPDFKQVAYCSKCRSAEYLWRRDNPKAH